MCVDELLAQQMGNKWKACKTLYTHHKFVYFLPPLLILSKALFFFLSFPLKKKIIQALGIFPQDPL